jgi:uncharacterized membrane protein YfhO
VTLRLPQLHPAGWVFLNDSFYPGWKAWADGKPAAIHRALGAFRAVELEAGVKSLRMAYRPGSLLWGAAVSLAAWLGILWLARRRNAGLSGKVP